MARKSSLIWWALGIGAAYFFLTRKASAATVPALPAPPGSPAVPMPLPPAATAPPVVIPPAVTSPQVAVAVSLWDTLTDASASNPGAGYVVFPSGSMAAFTFLPLATDGNGNYYTQWSGQVFKVSLAANADGNYTASGPVSQ